MKILLTIILLFTAAIYSQDTRTISIKPNTQGGFDIISNGELVYEFTKQNTDSASLATLDEIYYEGEKLGSKDGVVFVMPAEKGFDYLAFIMGVLTIFGAGLVAFLTNIFARKQYNRQIRAESKRQWLENIRNAGAEYFQMYDDISLHIQELDKSKSNPDATPEDAQNLVNELKNTFKTYSIKTIKFRSLFHKSNDKSFLDSLEENENLLSGRKYELAKEKMVTILEDYYGFINNAQGKLDRGEF